MAKLYFKVGSDWEEVVKLRNEIVKLKQELKNMDSTQSPAAFKTLNTQLAASTQRMDELVTGAAKAGAEMENGFKKKIFDASQSVNGFTEKIIAQKAVVKDVEADVKRLGDAYRTALKRNPLSANSKLDEYTSAKKALDEEKAALFGLTQQQAEARLSVKKLRDEYALFKEDSGDNTDAISAMKDELAGIGKTLFAGWSIKEFLGKMVQVRGEFQAADTAIQTLLGSKEKADKLMSQVREYAKISPLEFSDVTAATQMMLGFNIEAEKVPGFIKAIGDISMGEGQKFNSLTLAFSQMSATGKLMGQDLNQMINAGFNPLQSMADKTGKSISTLKDEMSKGAISAEMVQQAFIDATSAGGKFYQMSENASQTINGQLSMLQDAMDAAFNEMGQKTEGIIMTSIQMGASLIENYETIGKILVGLIATYGVYRTAVMLVTAAESKHTLVEIGLTNARVLARKAQLALNAAMLTNPYVALATVVVGLTATMWVMSDSTTAAARAQKEYNDIKDAASKKEQDHKQKIEELLTAARDESLATLTRQKSLEELRKEYPKIFEQYDVEKLKLEDILKLKQQINEEDSKRSVQGRKDDYESLKQTVSNQQRYLQLFDNPELRKNMSDADMQIWKMFAGKQSYVQVREQMEKNSELLKKYQKDVLDDNIASYKANLKNYSKEKLEAELKMAQSSTSKRNGFNVGGMMVKGGDLESIISSINGALAEKKSPNTYKQDYEKAKKDWEDAKKKLSEIENDKSKFTSKQYEEAKKREETTEKAYKDLGGVTGSSLTKQEDQAEKLREQAEALKVLREKQGSEQAKQEMDIENQAIQSKINAMTDGYEKEKAQRNLNNKMELDALKRQKEEYIQKIVDAQRQIFEAEENVKAAKDKNYRKKTFDASSVSVDTSIFNRIEQDTIKKQAAETAKYYNDILSQYQDYTTKRLNAEKKFNADREKLEKSGASDAQLKELELQRNETYNSIDKEFAMRETSFQSWANSIADLSLDKLRELLVQAERELERSEFLNPNDPNLATQRAKVASLKSTISDKATKNSTSPDKRSNKEWQELYRTLQEVNRGFDEIGDTVGGTAGEIISTAGGIASSTLQMIDGIMTLSNSSSEAMSGTAKAASASIQAVEKASVILAIISAAIQIATKIASLFSGSDSMDYYEDLKDQLEAINEIYGKIIDKSKEQIVFGGGFAALDSFKEANDLLERQIENYRKLAKAGGDARPSGAHSYAYRANERLSGRSASGKSGVEAGKGRFEDISKALGKNITKVQDLYNLTGEELYLIQTKFPEAWSKIPEEITDSLQAIIDCREESEKLKDSLNEAITGISYDSFYNNFIDQLSDMETSYEDMCDNFEEYLRKSMMAGLVADQYKEKIQELYDSWVAAGKDQDYTDQEVNDLRDARDKLIQSMIEERDNIAKIFGWTDSSSDSAKEDLESFVSQANGALTSLDLTAKDVSDNIYDYFRQSMINALYDKEYKSKMEELYKTFEDLSSDGLSESDMAQLGSQIDQYINEMLKGVEDVNSLFADKLKDAEDLQSFVDSVKSAMSSIEATAEDVTDNIFEYIRQQMVDKMFADTFQPQIEEFYKKVQEAMSDGSITDAEKDALRSEAEKLANDIVAAKDILSDTLGITSNNLKKELEEEFKSFSDGILNSLYDAEVTADSVAKDIADSMRKELIEAMYVEQYEPRIRAIWEKWKEYSSDGLVTDEERANIKNEINELSKEAADAAKEISDAWKDSGEEVKKAFESFSDSIKSVLYNAETTAEDVANNIYQYMRNALVDSMFTAQLQPQIQAWYDKYTEFMKDSAIDTAERKTLDEMIAEIQKAGIDIVDAANALFPSLDTGAIKRAEEAAQEAENAINEAKQEWESFSDSIKNVLYDTEATAEDIAKNIADSMRDELIEAMYIEQYEPRIKAIWEKWKEYSADGLVSDEERAQIKAEIDEISKEAADAAKEISDAWKDSGEEVRKAFESFSDSIKSVLYDSETTAEDVANNIYQYMRNALVDSMFAAQLQPQIKAWYDKYTEFMKDGVIDTEERKTLDEMIAEIQKAGVEIVDAANGLFPSLDTGAQKRAEEAAQEAENARNKAEQEWESFSDNILNSLYGIETTAEDISDNMGEYMRKALIKAMYVENFKPQMQKWYNEWQRAMGDGELTSEEKQTLDAMKQTMVDDMKKEVDAINQIFDSMYSQKASSKGFETMSQDDGKELSGRFAALQVAGEEIKNQSIQQTGLLSSINGKLSLLNLRSEDVPALMSGTPNIADRTRETIASGYQSQMTVIFPDAKIDALTTEVSNLRGIVDEMRTFQVEKFTDVAEEVTKISKNAPAMNVKLDSINDSIKKAL